MIEKFAVLYQQLEGEDQTKHEFLTDGYQDLVTLRSVVSYIDNIQFNFQGRVLQVIVYCCPQLFRLCLKVSSGQEEEQSYPKLFKSYSELH